MTDTLRPRTAPRLLDVDALHWFALFGILVVNLAYFASGYPFHLVAGPARGSWLDHSFEFGVRLLFEMKFYLLFSFLFGYSFTLQPASAAGAGANFTAGSSAGSAGSSCSAVCMRCCSSRAAS